MPGTTRLSSLKASSAFGFPEMAAERIERHAEAVAVPVRIDPLDVAADFTADRRTCSEERVVGGRRAVRIQAKDDAGEVCVVRGGATE
jgi:hypothetical protein